MSYYKPNPILTLLFCHELKNEALIAENASSSLIVRACVIWLLDLPVNTITNSNKKTFLSRDYKSLYLTSISSLAVILFYFSLPSIFEFKRNTIDVSIEVTNKSKSNFEKVLAGEDLEVKSKIDKGLNVEFLFDDVFKFDETPNDLVRLSASTIEQLFKETDYNLKNVRKTKLVKPISLSLLPKEIKLIENTKRKKNLFIKIILPIIIEENNRIKLDRR